MRLRICLLTLLVGVVSCGGEEKKADEVTGLNEDQTRQLLAINESFLDVEEAIGLQWPKSAANEKAQKMQALLSSGACTVVRSRPSEDFNRDWTSHDEVYGDTDCPLVRNYLRRYSAARGEWSMVGDYLVRSPEFAKLTVVRQVQMVAKLARSVDGARTRIRGGMNWVNFNVEGLGVIHFHLQTQQEYLGPNRGGGVLTFTIDANKAFKHTVQINWNVSDLEPAIRLNGQTISLNQFHKLFSGYGIMDLINISLKMR